jgi:hypothetical protein
MVLISCDSFLDCLPHGDRILPRRILTHVVAASVLALERGTVCPEKMVTVRALIVNEEPGFTTELAFANCGNE